jgi:nucleoid-associated protein YgaU
VGRDKVLGLSLAILLIGFGAAFCFRNEPFVENGLKLARAKILDEGIAQRPGPKPYIADSKSDSAPPSKPTVTLGGIQAIDAPAPGLVPARSRTAQSRRPDDAITMTPVPTSPSEDTRRPTVVEQFVSSQKDRSEPDPAPSQTTAADSSSAIVDKPLELTIRPNSPAFSSPDSLLDDAMTWQHAPDGRDGCPAMTTQESDHIDRARPDSPTRPAAGGEPLTYSVRRGDTLTKIAQHFLGDSNRYREIFNANRDQLQSPNARLKVGMTLRIPKDRTHSKHANAGNMSLSQSKPARPNDPANGASRSRQVSTTRPVSRTRDISKAASTEKPPTADPVRNDAQNSTGTPRFIPVTKGPFWRSRDDSRFEEQRSRNLSQRAPDDRSKDDATPRDGEHQSDRDEM